MAAAHARRNENPCGFVLLCSLSETDSSAEKRKLKHNRSCASAVKPDHLRRRETRSGTAPPVPKKIKSNRERLFALCLAAGAFRLGVGRFQPTISIRVRGPSRSRSRAMVRG